MAGYLKTSLETALAEVAAAMERGVRDGTQATALLLIREIVAGLPGRDRRARARIVRDRIARDTNQLLLLTADRETAEAAE